MFWKRSLFRKNSVAGRIFIAKSIGFLLGGAAFILLQAFQAETTMKFEFGIWLTFILMSLMIALVGILDRHPVFNFRMAFWFRGAVVGGAFFLLLVLVGFEQVQSLLTLDVVAWTGLTSPWWILIDGIFYGIIIAWITTWFGGEGDLPVR